MIWAIYHQSLEDRVGHILAEVCVCGLRTAYLLTSHTVPRIACDFWYRVTCIKLLSLRALMLEHLHTLLVDCAPCFRPYSYRKLLETVYVCDSDACPDNILSPLHRVKRFDWPKQRSTALAGVLFQLNSPPLLQPTADGRKVREICCIPQSKVPVWFTMATRTIPSSQW